MINDNMIKVLVSNGGDEIYVGICKNRKSRKKQLVFVIKDAGLLKGETIPSYTPPIYKPLLNFQIENLKWLCQYGNNITLDDVIKVSDYIIKNFKNMHVFGDKQNENQMALIKNIVNFCQDETNEESVQTVKNSWCISVEAFKKLTTECGYTMTDAAKVLNESGLLNANKGRYTLRLKDNSYSYSVFKQKTLGFVNGEEC